MAVHARNLSGYWGARGMLTAPPRPSAGLLVPIEGSGVWLTPAPTGRRIRAQDLPGRGHRTSPALQILARWLQAPETGGPETPAPTSAG